MIRFDYPRLTLTHFTHSLHSLTLSIAHGGRCSRRHGTMQLHSFCAADGTPRCIAPAEPHDWRWKVVLDCTREVQQLRERARLLRAQLALELSLSPRADEGVAHGFVRNSFRCTLIRRPTRRSTLCLLPACAARPS